MQYAVQMTIRTERPHYKGDTGKPWIRRVIIPALGKKDAEEIAKALFQNTADDTDEGDMVHHRSYEVVAVIGTQRGTVYLNTYDIERIAENYLNLGLPAKVA